jgi:hypothetical protein
VDTIFLQTDVPIAATAGAHCCSALANVSPIPWSQRSTPRKDSRAETSAVVRRNS